MLDPLVLSLVGLATLAALVLVLGYVAYHGMIRYRMRDEAYQRQAGLESGDFDASVFELPWIEENIASAGGYPLRVHALEPEDDRGAAGLKLAVFHHGIGWGWLGMIRYMELFRAEGWTVVAYDSRGHGSSGTAPGDRGRGSSAPERPARPPRPERPARPERPSYGFFEKEDLRKVVDWSFDSFAGSGGASGGRSRLRARARQPRLAIFGESMGAATALQYAPLDPRVDAVIADCPFSSAMGELEYRLKCARVPPGFRALAALAADAFCRRLEGFSLRDADPSRAILETEVPILFIHGLEDHYVPWTMSVVMAERRRRVLPDAITELLLVPGAKHAECIRADRRRYAEALSQFLDKALA